MKFHETIIIGAGPGGLACALTLAGQGRDVLLLEKHEHIGGKVCAGGVTWSGLLNRIPAELLERSFSAQDICSNWQRTTISSATPMIATINRRKMGQWQSEAARKAGVKIVTGARVRTITDRTVTTDRAAYRYRYLVGADGSASVVRRHLRLPIEDMGVGIHHEVSGDFNRMEWHVNTRLFGSGYAWIFPHRDHASIGVYSHRQGLPARTLHRRLLLWAAEQGIALGASQPRAAVINFDYRGFRFGDIFLVGDAAGLASGLTGEGIFPAILSGEAVGRIIGNQDHQNPGLDRLLRKHCLHRRFLAFAAANRFARAATTELMVLALRLRLLRWNALEMGE